VTTPEDIGRESQQQVAQIQEDGELPLQVRRRLVEHATELLGAGQLFRVALSCICAKRAWPIWEDAFPDEPAPMAMAERALAMVTERRRSGPTVGDQDVLRLKSYLDDKLLLGDEYFRAVYAGFAAWAVARDAVEVQPVPSVVSDGYSERDVPPEEWDACFFASLAEAGGAIWENNTSESDRRRFWAWYLTDAIPRAAVKVAG
jgi:hypothetical protein